LKAKNRGIRSEESRQRLIDGAVESILKVGYARTTIGELVKQAGLSKGAHVYHFKSKLDLMRAEVLFLMDGVGYLLRGLALQHILQKNTTQDKRCCTGVESSPVTSLTVSNGAVEPCA